VQESLGDVDRWMPELNAGLSEAQIEIWIDDAAEFWQRGETFHLLIVDATDGSLVGGCGLTRLDTRHMFANLYYWVRSSRQGQGAATQASRLAAALAFEGLGLQRLEILTAQENLGSQRVAEKIGAVREGLLRKRLLLPDHTTTGSTQAHDAYLYALIRED
jgi:RimJ/RimL family protein N-acetyltransferase